MVAYYPNFSAAYNNGGATLTCPMPGKPLIFKAFRASLTLGPAGDIAAADTEGCGDLPLGQWDRAAEAIAQADDLSLPGSEHLPHQAAELPGALLLVEILQQGILRAHDVTELQGVALPVRLNGVRKGHLPLELPLGPEVHEDLIRYPLLTDT